jgi:hypothetical protein
LVQNQPWQIAHETISKNQPQKITGGVAQGIGLSSNPPVLQKSINQSINRNGMVLGLSES